MPINLIFLDFSLSSICDDRKVSSYMPIVFIFIFIIYVTCYHQRKHVKKKRFVTHLGECESQQEAVSQSQSV